VKRCEKLLRLGEKRLVQSVSADVNAAAAGSGIGSGFGKGKKGKRKIADMDHDHGGDNIELVAEAVEAHKSKRRRLASIGGGGGGAAAAGEQVLFTGTGRAIGRVAELGGWFLQRGEIYAVRVETGSVGGIDDVRVERREEIDEEKGHQEEGMEVEGEVDEEGAVAVDKAGGDGGSKTEEHAKAKEKEKPKEKAQETEKVPKVVSEEFSRIRQMSVLKVFVSLR
jgi:ribonuclease P/MRP protein subunit POP7